MDTSTAQWPQGIGLVKPIVMDHHNHNHNQNDQEIRNGNACNRGINNGGESERRATRPQEQLNCPRCNSTNTKFCYYNNYSLTQPRYFCKGCRRYWTEGGSLRNVPVGGGSRKNKRSSSSSSSTYKLPDLNPHDHKQIQAAGHDLNLSFQGSFNMQLPKMENHQNESSSNNPCSNSSPSSALDLLRTGIAGSFIDSNTSLYSSSSAPAGGFSLQSTHHHHQLMSFPVMDALATNGSHAGRLFFPFGDFNKQVTAAAAGADQDNNNKGNNANANANRYWNGMLQGGGGGGSSW